MLLIADSGSTKCDWVIYKDINQEPFKIRTKGINPAVLSKKKLKGIIIKNLELYKYKDLITSIYFFGAGCGTKKNQNKIDNILTSFFKKAKSNTKEDIMAAVYATTNTPAVVCILGTGSNCCYFDGTNITLKTPALGYIIMDEGSGNHLGKNLLQSYYYKKMPIELRLKFEKKFNLKEKKVIKKLYHSSTPNKYLAEFSLFLFENKDNPFIKNLIIDAMDKFIENHILQYSEELKTVPLHFVGSIAYFAKDYIEIALNKKGLKASSFIRRPIDNLINHIKTEGVA
ncbi:N-acetylglucosamine kinase [uncultured Lacinutrix sp.]|uniref:N-acetylglucosamine kinase n=1 Tax=uncultured Lacinutrix sp. TaxID=574032 RepID=UPI00262444EA|nr:N-acetylglucosamine kinase [uncultured Lacinutrix sp.]